MVGTEGRGSDLTWSCLNSNRRPPVASGGQDIGNLYAVDAQDKDAPEVCYGSDQLHRVEGFCQITIEIHRFPGFSDQFPYALCIPHIIQILGGFSPQFPRHFASFTLT